MTKKGCAVSHVEQLCDQFPTCLLGGKPTLGPGTPSDNLPDAAGLPPTHQPRAQAASPKTKGNSSMCEENTIKQAR